MASKSSRRSGKKVRKSKDSEGKEYPNIIEEPIRVIGDEERGKSKAKKATRKSRKLAGKK
jgi:hypothetical protein